MAEAATTPAPDAPAKKSNLLLIIVAIAMTAAATGGGVYFAVNGKQAQTQADVDEEESEEDAQDQTDKAGKKKGKKGKPGKSRGPALYVKFDPPFVVNFEAKGLMRFLQITIEVMSRDQKTIELLKQHDPIIRNNLLMLFGNQGYEKINSREGKESLRAEALTTVAAIIEEEGGDGEKVEQLYFTSFVMQ